MILLEHSTFDEDSIGANLGAPEYSYWFVRKAFRRVLQRFGVVVPVTSPERDVDRIFRSAQRHGQACAFLAFNPPQYVPTDLACPTIPMFAWEFDTIPDETWNANPREDWRYVLARTGVGVTHSSAAAHAVRRSMGEGFPVWSIPAPVFDTARRAVRSRTPGPVELELEGALAIDVGRLDLALFTPERAPVDGQRALRLLRRASNAPGQAPQRLRLDGIVYTAVLNPSDGRKNWVDLAAGFLWAFRDTPDATLVLKLTQSDLVEGVLPVLEHLGKFGRFACRVVLVHGFLSEEAYARLVAATHFAVNTADGEGQCLPLMEFMSAGRPAVAPRHTAMLDYVTPANAFVVDSRTRPAFWPHDERQATRCLRHQISFASLVGAFRDSFRVARDEPARHARMGEAAAAALEAYCGDAVVTERLGEVFDRLGLLQPPSTAGVPNAGPPGGARVTDPLPAPCPDPPLPPRVDSYEMGLHDAELSGWYDKARGELMTGFPVGPRDVVVDVGCGDGGAAAFCARRGAHLVLCDVDAERLRETTARLANAPARRLEAHVTDGQPLPLPDGYASRVVCTEVLEHVADPDAFVAELVRIGAPGALYLLTVPGEATERLQQQLAPPVYFEAPNHIRIFSGQAFHDLVERAGLVIEKRLGYGAFWTLWFAFFWQTEVPLGRSHPSLDAWASTWSQVLAGKDGRRIKTALDAILPKAQVVVARKP